MEKRSQPRVEADQAVYVTMLGEEDQDGSKTSKADAHFVARITNYSSRGMGLIIGGPVPMGAAVKVEWSNTLLLGEVCYCHRRADGFAIGLHLEHALYDTLELAALGRRLLQEAPEREHAGKKA